jgi:PAS domain-containing protein
VHACAPRIENEDLVERLAASEAQLRTSVDDAIGRVAELQRAQDAYDRLAAQEQLMLDTLPVGIAFFSGRVIVRCNQRLEQMLGYGRGKSRQVLAHAVPSDKLWNEAGERYKLLASGQVMEGEFKLRRKDGSAL